MYLRPKNQKSWLRPKRVFKPALPILDRFMQYVQKKGEDDCWLWIGAVFKPRKKYGAFTICAGKTVRASRFAYEQFVGPIPSGKLVRHSCNTSLCCNPKHLLVGTHFDN